MKLDTKHFRGNACFIAHAIEAEDYVGTMWDERGERRHILPRDEAALWLEDMSVPVEAAFVPVDSEPGPVVPIEAATFPRIEEVKVATEAESGNSTLGGEKAKKKR